ncbi:hypothetical protein QJQ45_013199 [Haematococcus lacustris]|nr:hypothetical protein QJQ45_013199 [Haematococcus lacustris]
MPKDVRDKMSWLQRNEVSLYTLKRWHAMWGAPPCAQAASPATAFKAPPLPCHQERDTVTGAFTAAYACSNAALLTLPNVSCQQLGPLRTAVAAAEFPDAPPQPQAGPSTVRRHQLMLTRKIQGTFKSQLSKAPAVHVQMDGCTIKNGKVVLFCASASIPAPVPSLPTSSLTPLAAGPPTPLAADPPTPLAADPPTPLAADPPTPLAAGPPTPAQILTHGHEPCRILCRVLDIRKCPDSTAAAQAHDLEQLLKEANLWELLASVTVDSAASNVGRTAMFKYLGAHSKVYLQLPHLLPAMASSDATYAAHAARRVLEEDTANRKQWEAWEEQQQEEERQQDHGNRKRMRRPLPPQSCNPAEYDPFNTISMFRADIEAMAANEACSPRLFMHLVHFFGAAPTSNAHVESALQHAKHGHGSKQGLAALLGTVIAKTDPASFRTMDAVDLQPRMKALRKEQRDMERASAAKTAVARAARKAVTESCMVGGNKQLVLNIGTVASLGQLRAASSRHPRGADYSATTLEEAAAFTLAQLWGYINFYKIPPKHRPAQKTLLQNLRRFVKQHIEQRTKAALSSGPGGVA